MVGCANSPPGGEPALSQSEAKPDGELPLRSPKSSDRLSDAMERLHEKLPERGERVGLKPQEPRFDPLATQIVSIDLVRARVSEAARALSENSSLNLIVDPRVNALTQRATLSMEEVSVRKALDNILSVYDVHGERQGNTLRITLNDERVYALEFLNTSTQLSTSDGGNVFGDEADELTGNQKLQTTSGSQGKPYDVVRQTVTNIIGERQEVRVLNADRAEQAAAATNRPGRASQANASEAGGYESTGDDEAETRELAGKVSLDRNAGTLYVKARPSRIEAVDRYIEQLEQTLSRQVFIEAQIIDVELTDEFQFGIDWTLLRDNFAGTLTGQVPQLGQSVINDAFGGGDLPSRTLTIPQRSLNAGDGSSLGLAVQGDRFSAVAEALERFGDATVLSNPNILARNGSPAQLSVGTSSRFVSESESSEQNAGGGQSTVTVDVETENVFDGITVGVVPYIKDNGRVELLVRPLQTNVVDGTLALQEVGGENEISLPQVRLKGLTTTLGLNDGDLVLIGGLIDRTADERDQGLPGLASLPVVGGLFGQRSRVTKTRELVIALRVRVR
jgi:general secretion pathway protein D